MELVKSANLILRLCVGIVRPGSTGLLTRNRQSAHCGTDCVSHHCAARSCCRLGAHCRAQCALHAGSFARFAVELIVFAVAFGAQFARHRFVGADLRPAVHHQSHPHDHLESVGNSTNNEHVRRRGIRRRTSLVVAHRT
jgi:hypothetical protein